MEKFLFFFTLLGIPALILLTNRISVPKSKAGIIIGSLFQLAFLLFLFLWGQYPLVGSYYIRYALIIIMLIILVKGWMKWKLQLPLFHKGWKSYLILGILIISTPILLYWNINAIYGLSSKVSPVLSLNFPLKNGTYYVSSGGNTAIINNHFRSYPNSQQFAIDINQVNRFASASANIISGSSEKHLIFGSDIYCPCSGIVTKTGNDVPDNLTADMNVKPENGRGNYIDLECDGYIISMSHMKMGSVLVKAGDEVLEDQLLAKVGNSGFSQEPHLHIQAAEYNKDSVLVGVRVSYDGRWLVRNALVRKD